MEVLSGFESVRRGGFRMHGRMVGSVVCVRISAGRENRLSSVRNSSDSVGGMVGRLGAPRLRWLYDSSMYSWEVLTIGATKYANVRSNGGWPRCLAVCTMPDN